MEKVSVDTKVVQGPPSYEEVGANNFAQPPTAPPSLAPNTQMPQYGHPPQFSPGYGYPQPPIHSAPYVAPSPVNVTPVIVQAPAAAPVQQQQTVVINNNPQHVIKPNNYMCLAIFTLLCCNLPLGIVALIFSCISDARYGEGDVQGARCNGRVSMWLSVAGILVTIVVISVIIAVQRH